MAVLLSLIKKRCILEFHHDLSMEGRVIKFIVRYFNFLNSKKLVGIAPFAKHSCKEYSLENIIKVIDLLRSKVSVILFGAAGKEHKRLKDIAKNRENTFSIAGELTLKEEMDVISNLDFETNTASCL